jgi:hypothetical protein
MIAGGCICLCGIAIFFIQGAVALYALFANVRIMEFPSLAYEVRIAGFIFCGLFFVGFGELILKLAAIERNIRGDRE